MMGASSCRLLQRWCPRLRFLPTAKDLGDPHRPTATGTQLAKGERDRLGRRFGGCDGERLPQQVPDLRDVGFATGTGQQAVVPDTVEAIGQDMDQETANELIGGQSHDRSSVAGLDAVSPRICISSIIRWRSGVVFSSFIETSCLTGGKTLIVSPERPHTKDDAERDAERRPRVQLPRSGLVLPPTVSRSEGQLTSLHRCAASQRKFDFCSISSECDCGRSVKVPVCDFY